MARTPSEAFFRAAMVIFTEPRPAGVLAAAGTFSGFMKYRRSKSPGWVIPFKFAGRCRRRDSSWNQALDIGNANSWGAAPGPIVTNGIRLMVTDPTPAVGKFYRLRKP